MYENVNYTTSSGDTIIIN